MISAVLDAPTCSCANKWFGYTVRSYYDQRMALIPLVDETQPFCEGVVDAVREAVVDAWRRYSPALEGCRVRHQRGHFSGAGRGFEGGGTGCINPV